MNNARSERRQNLVVVGNGMAGARAIDELLRLAPERYNITVFGAEPWGNYNRILLSQVLAGERRIEDIMINAPEWYAHRGIALHTGDPVVRIDRAHRCVHSRAGRKFLYDQLLLATGSKPVLLPVPGHDLPGVLTFRDLHDVQHMLAAARVYQKAVIIGGGLLGLEAAHGLHRRGMDVTVVHLMDTLMERQLDVPAGLLLQQTLERRGLRFRMGTRTVAILGTDRVTGVRFADSSELDADLVVMAVGIQPDISLARDCGLRCERGVVVNDAMQTSDPLIYAIGECAEHRGQCYGLVAPLYEQAQVCASHLAGLTGARYVGSVTATSLKVSGIHVFSAGAIDQNPGCETLLYTDLNRGVYRKLLIRDGLLRGAVLMGDIRGGPWYARLIAEAVPIRDFREGLIFGPEYAKSPPALAA